MKKAIFLLCVLSLFFCALPSSTYAEASSHEVKIRVTYGGYGVAYITTKSFMGEKELTSQEYFLSSGTMNYTYNFPVFTDYWTSQVIPTRKLICIDDITYNRKYEIELNEDNLTKFSRGEDGSYIIDVYRE